MHDTRYEAPHSIEEAVIMLASGSMDDVRVLAGGTDLLVQMTSGGRSPSLIINLKHIPELTQISFDEAGALHLGAAANAFSIGQDARIRDRFPGLYEAAGLIGSDQIQGRASVGGNLCNASPAADTIPSLLTLGARCHIAGPHRSARVVPVAEFVLGPGRTALEPGELLVELEIPAPPPRSADAYLRLIPRTEMDIAVAGASVRIALAADGSCSDASVALGAVAPTPIQVPEAATALRGSRLEEADLERAAEAARAACRPLDDKRGPADYRRRIAGVLTKRAATSAARRAAER